jgi:hypothetical protein
VRSATFPAYTLGVREVPVHTCAMAPSIEGSARRQLERVVADAVRARLEKKFELAGAWLSGSL